MTKYINKDKLLYYQERFEDRNRPISSEMIMTNFCNYDCEYCRYKHGNGYFKFEGFKKAVRKLQGMGVKGFILTGGGEPLLNPDIEKILRWLDENRIPYGINTNFTKYIENKPKWLKVSLHDNYDLENVIYNIKRFRSKNKETVLGIQAIIEDIEDIEKFYNKYKDLDVDYMAFRPLEVQYKAYEDKEVEKIVKELEKLRNKDGKVLINYKWYMIDKKFDKCYANWTIITVDYLGDVWYCCHKPQEVVGNLFKDKDIMKLKREWVSDMSKCDIPCRMTCNNIIMEEYREIEHIEFM